LFCVSLIHEARQIDGVARGDVRRTGGLHVGRHLILRHTQARQRRDPDHLDAVEQHVGLRLRGRHAMQAAAHRGHGQDHVARPRSERAAGRSIGKECSRAAGDHGASSS
jgi:hypothetical protein